MLPSGIEDLGGEFCSSYLCRHRGVRERNAAERTDSCERRESRARRTEPGWRAAVLDERESRHAFRLRASEEGSG
jgi:hypothetical protein